MRWDWEMGVAFGQALQQLQGLDRRVSALEAELHLVKLWGLRGLVLLALWGLALALNLPAEDLGRLLAGLIQALSGRGG